MPVRLQTILLFSSVTFLIHVANNSEIGGTSCPDSSNWLADIVSVDVENCTLDSICHLVRGSTKQIKITFKPKDAIEIVKPHVNGIIAGIPIFYPMTELNGCIRSGLQCPLQKDEEVTYEATIPVLKVYPKMKVPIVFELISTSTNDVIVCIMINSEIVSASKHLD